MANITLTAAPVLGTDLMIGKNRIVERSDLALVSIAVPLDGEVALAKALKTGWALSMPDARHSTMSGKARLIQTAQDQLFLAFPHSAPDANAVVNKKLDGAGYTTEQTDNWSVFEISGPDTRAALERLCPLDLHPDVFAIADVGRTVMEHMGAIIVRSEQDTFLLMSARSSAPSFLHAIETSFRNVC